MSQSLTHVHRVSPTSAHWLQFLQTIRFNHINYFKLTIDIKYFFTVDTVLLNNSQTQHINLFAINHVYTFHLSDTK